MSKESTRSTGVGRVGPWRPAWGWVAAALLGGAGCPTQPPDLPLAQTLGAGDTGSQAEPDHGEDGESTGDVGSSSGDESDASSEGSSSDGEAASGGAVDCDLFAQDCGAGEKCMPVASDGGSVWDATQCRPLDPSPDPIGSSCTAFSSGTSGIDSCERGAMCWHVDDALEGTCIELCGGSAESPTCDTAGTSCVISNNDALAVCLPTCHPLDSGACLPDEGCYLVPTGLVCAPDASGMAGAQGDPCEAVNGCDPGLLCVGAASVPGCAGDIGCCTAACDLTTPSCPQATECVSVFVDGMGPRELLDLGVCIAPA